jgi:hypothetical protein
MIKQIFLAALFLFASSFVSQVFAQTEAEAFQYPIYFGMSAGYGSTTWGYLVPPENRASATMALSTPISVTEGGPVWGFFLGYELLPQFAVEGNYQRYQQAEIHFTRKSLFTFQHHGLLQFNTNTESFSLSGKIMLIIPHTTVRIYSSIGAAATHRQDMLANRWRAEPAFGLGFNYNINPHLMAEVGSNYTGGYGEAEISPVNDFVPFLYSVFFRLAYRF